MHSSDTELKAYEYEPSVAYIVTLTLMVPCRAVLSKIPSLNRLTKLGKHVAPDLSILTYCTVDRVHK